MTPDPLLGDSSVRPPMSEAVEVGQEWAAFGGGTFSLIRVVEVLDGQYLRPPDVAIVPTEFCRVEWLTGRLKGQITDQRAPRHRLGFGHHVLYRRADGSLTPWAEAQEERARRHAPCPTCGRRR